MKMTAAVAVFTIMLCGAAFCEEEDAAAKKPAVPDMVYVV